MAVRVQGGPDLARSMREKVRWYGELFICEIES